MSKKKPIVRVRKIAIDPNPQGNLKALGGGQYDDWNNWLASRTSEALPVNQKDDDRATEATVAVYSGMIDLSLPIRLREYSSPNSWPQIRRRYRCTGELGHSHQSISRHG